ncbi:MAG: ParB/RepB/Spo0J family partition protein [Novosphingobium sp.]
MIIRDFTIDQLCVSPLNVRINERDANAVEALAANIEARGLLFPLIVHPTATVPPEMWPDGLVGGPSGAAWAALAGGRRYRALRLLVATGRLAHDAPIATIVRDLPLAEITELSLAENLLRRELQGYEVHAAIARAIDQGATIEEVAENIGQEILWVRQQKRLGALAPDIFAEYAASRLSFDQAKAYASTEDHALQRAAFAHFRGAIGTRHDAAAIRAFLKVGDRELERLLRFVGAEAYRAAGGRFELDLFADAAEERGRVVDEALLRDLVESRLAEIRQELRAALGCPDMRFLAEAPRRTGVVDHFLQLAAGEFDGAPARAAIAAGRLAALIEIEEDGSHHHSWWWASRQAKADARRPAPSPAPPPADPGSAIRTPVFAPHREANGLTAEGQAAVAALRRELLRALLVRDAARGGSHGRDYLVWAQLRQLLGEDGAREVGASGPPRAQPRGLDQFETARALVAESEANLVWFGAIADIQRQDFMALEDAEESLAAFLALDDQTRALAGAVLAGLTLLPSAGPGDIPVHDCLARLAGATDAILREYWTPTAGFMELFPKAQRLKLAEPLFGPSVTASWTKLDDADLARAAARAFTGSPRRPTDWVHPLLRFGPDEAPEDNLIEETAP